MLPIISRYFCPTLILAILTSSSVSAGQKDPFEPTIGGIIWENLQTAVDKAREANQNAALGTRDIQAARDRYWKLFPSGPGFSAAEAEFSRKLWAKDLYFLTLALPEGLGSPTTRVVDALVVKVDGGIRPTAYPAFVDWVQAVRRELGARRANDLVFVEPGRLARAMDATKDRYVSYKGTRDWAEFEASGLDLRKFISPKAYALRLMENRLAREIWDPEIPKPNTRNEATKVYDTIAGVVGEKDVLTAAETVLSAKRDVKGELITPVEIQLASEGKRQVKSCDLWFEFLLTTSDRGYALGLLRNPLSGYEVSWRRASNEYKEFVSKFGEKRVLDAAKRVRSAPKTPAGTLADSTGWGQPPVVWFRKILTDPTTQVPTGQLVTLKITDIEGLRAAANKVATVQGTVSHITSDPDPPGRLIVHFRDTQAVTAHLVNPEPFDHKFGKDAFGLKGQTIQLTGDFWLKPEGIAFRIVDLKQLKVVDTGSTGEMKPRDAEPSHTSLPPKARTSNITREKASFAPASYVTLEATSVRSGPGVNFEVVASIPADMRVRVVASEGDWLKVQSKRGNPPGYIPARSARRE